MVALTPLLGDDLWYMMTSSGASGKWMAFKAVCSEVARHWSFDTGRLANLINPPFLVYVPKWIFGIITGGFTVVMIELSRRFAGVSMGSVLSWCVVFAIVFVLPWLDYMFTVVYALNYVWTATVSLLALYFVTKRVPEGRWAFGFAMICCLVAGWMHEGFSMPILSGLAVYFIVKRKITRRQMWLAGAWILGAMLIFVSPAFWNRTSGSYSIMVKFAGWESLLSATLFNCLSFLYVAVFLLTELSGKSRWRIKEQGANAFAWMFMVVVLAGSALFYMYYNGSRMGFVTQLFAAIGIAYILKYRWKACGDKVRVLVGAIVVICMSAHYVKSVMEQETLRKEFYEIVRLYDSSADGIIYYDNIKPKIGVSLLRPSYRTFNEHFPMQNFSCYYGPYKPDLVIVPRVLETIDMKKAQISAGTPLFIYEGHILMKGWDEKIRKVRIRTDAGSEIVSRVRQDEITTIDGKRYLHIVPHLQYSPLKMKYKEIFVEEFGEKK